MSKIRLDKWLSSQGIGTRTEVKKLIKSGKVTLNDGPIKDFGIKVDTDIDKVMVSGEEVGYEEFVYLMLNKPKGVVSATEDKRDQTVIDIIDHPMKKVLFPVGRLDKDTTGLLLLTNDGKLSHNLLAPKKHVVKSYFALVYGQVDHTTIASFKKGLRLEDGYETMPADLFLIPGKAEDVLKEKNVATNFENLDHRDYSTVIIHIKEGKFHQIKRMFEAVDMTVVELKRESMGSLNLDSNLKSGDFRQLSKEEIRQLKEHEVMYV